MVEVSVRRLDPRAQLPRKATSGAAGWDLFALERVCLLPGARALVRTGISLAIPAGYEMQVRPRSGLALRHGVTLLNSPGTIDSDYRGEVGVILVNHGEESFEVEAGARVAQAVVAELAPVAFLEVEVLDTTARGAGGFGSTGH